MPFAGNDWLALTQEPTLEPELPICDAHHHLWDFRTERIPYQRYLLHELAADITSGHNVRSTVFIECRSMYRPDGSEEMRPVGEVEFVQGQAAASASGLYGPGRAAAAIIGKANLFLGDRVQPILEALQAASPSRFRGVRHSARWDTDPQLARAGVEGQLGHADYRAGAQRLAQMGLCLENSLFFPQLTEMAAFAKAVPDLTIIVNHLGGLCRIGHYANRDNEVIPRWRQGIAAIAACPNIIMKLGGIGLPWMGFGWHTCEVPVDSEILAETTAPFITYCIEQFGPERCMFESNFPVDKVSCSYNILYNAFKRVSQDYSANERAAMFHDTATRVYRIDV